MTKTHHYIMPFQNKNKTLDIEFLYISYIEYNIEYNIEYQIISINQ